MPLDKEASGNYRGRMQTWPRWPPVGYVTDHPRGRGHHSGLPPGGLPPKTSMTQKVSDMSTGLLGLVPKGGGDHTRGLGQEVWCSRNRVDL